MKPKAMIVWGGWDGHEPDKVAVLFSEILNAEGFEVTVFDSLDAFQDAERVKGQDLLVPIWTMGQISGDQAGPVFEAVALEGVGLAGCHGGMCDAFRENTEWQFMTGGQWVAHPGNDGTEYPVHIVRSNPSPITDGLADFTVKSEQYYLHTDPGNNVLATTPFPLPGVDGPHAANRCDMPTVWTKMYGKGRVFYNALGHQADVLASGEPRELMRRGILWAARGVGL
jgi:hypothetical protein